MADARVSTLLADVAELERRDEAIAAEISVLAELAARAGAVRSRATEVQSELERIPASLADLASRRRDAEAAASTARSQLELAEERLAALSQARLGRDDEIERLRREAATARELLFDQETNLERLELRREQLHGAERALRNEEDELGLTAGAVAGDLERVSRVGEAARGEPGQTLEELEEWGARVRSALFVARSTLEAERELVIAEANALGSSALGEGLGAASVALVRRRLETEL